MICSYICIDIWRYTWARKWFIKVPAYPPLLMSIPLLGQPGDGAQCKEA